MGPVGRSCYSLLMERHEGGGANPVPRACRKSVHIDSGSFHPVGARNRQHRARRQACLAALCFFFFGRTVKGVLGGNAECIDYAKTCTEQCELPATLYYRLRYGDDRGWSEVKGCIVVYVIYDILIFPRRISGVRKKGKPPFEITPTASESHRRRRI